MIVDDSDNFGQLYSTDYPSRPTILPHDSGQKDLVVVFPSPTTVAHSLTLPQAGIPVRLATGVSPNLSVVSLPQPMPTARNVVQLQGQSNLVPMTMQPFPIYTQSNPTNWPAPLSTASPRNCILIPAASAPRTLVLPSPTNPAAGTPRAGEQHAMLVRMSPFDGSASSPAAAAGAFRPPQQHIYSDPCSCGPAVPASVAQRSGQSVSPVLSPITSMFADGSFLPQRRRQYSLTISSSARVTPELVAASAAPPPPQPAAMSDFTGGPVEMMTYFNAKAAATDEFPTTSSSSASDQHSSGSDSTEQSTTSSISCQPADRGDVVDMDPEEDTDGLLLSAETLDSVTEASTAKQVFTSMATQSLRHWVCKNIQYPYASKVEKRKLARESGLDTKQVSSWLTNARRRLIPKLISHENKLRCERGLAPLAIITRKRKAARSSSKSSLP